MTTKFFKKAILATIITVMAGLLAFSSTSYLNTASAAGDVPEWFKGVAGFWAEGNISTAEFLSGITFLLEQEIITVEGYGLLTEAQGDGGDSASHNDIWQAVGDLQEQMDEKMDMESGILATMTCQAGSTIIRTDSGWSCISVPTNLQQILDDKMDWEAGLLSSIVCDPNGFPFRTSSGWQCVDVSGGSSSGEIKAYQKYGHIKPDSSGNVRINCDPGDIATGGGLGHIGQTVWADYPLPSHSNPSANGPAPSGWTVVTDKNGSSLDIWVTCLDVADGVLKKTLTLK